jgi:RNA polymerase sigma-70 factor (ECF subfamily)
MPSRDEHRAWIMAAVAAYEQRLVRFAARLVRDEHAARDAVQHTFLKLCGERADRIGGTLAQWLFTVCRNRAIDWLRSRRGQILVDTDDWQEHEAFASDADDPAELCADHELGQVLLALVEELPDGQRESLLLWLEGWKARQIAEITGRKQTTVRVQLHTALKSLREHPRVQAIVHSGTKMVESSTTSPGRGES